MEQEDSLFCLCLHLDNTSMQVLSSTSSFVHLSLKSFNSSQHFWKCRSELLLNLSISSSLEGCWKQAYYALYNNKPTSNLLASKVQHLYADLELNISVLFQAAINSNLEAIEYLLTIKSRQISMEEVMQCVKQNSSENVSLAKMFVLLQDSRLNTSMEVANGYRSLTWTLIQDGTIDPTVDNNFLFKLACQEGYLELAEVLLGYQKTVREIGLEKEVTRTIRVDPRAGDNYAMKAATRREHTDIVKLLEVLVD